MAAQALYRTWRSQTFDELVGQEHVVQTLRNALVEGRLAHAYLFTGPRGVGKTTVARLLAKAVNCTTEPLEARPCGACRSCSDIADGASVDVIELDAASHTSVEDAREIIERVQFRPTNGRYKVYIIDEVHMLSTAAFNALLKTLEEPPDHALFILATTENHKIPATILSRCQRFTFNRHSVAATIVHLQHVAASENLVLEAGAAEAIARSATGSMRDAISVLDQLRSYGSSTIGLDLVRQLLGSSAAAEVSALVDALLDDNMQAALRAVNAVADQGADLRQFSRDLVERLRALLLISAGGAAELRELGDDELAQLRAQAERGDTAALLQWVKLFSALDYQLRTSPYGQLPLELAVVEALLAPAAIPAAASAPTRRAAPAAPAPAARPAAPPKAAPAAPPPVLPSTANGSASPILPTAAPMPQTTEPETTEPRTQNPEPRTQNPEPGTSAQAATPDPEAVQVANADIATLEHVEALWPQVVRDVRPRDKMVYALVRDVRPVNVEGNTVVLLASSPFHRGQVERSHNRQIIEEVLSKHLGAQFAIVCTLEERAEEQDLRGQIRKARKDPWVKAAINLFDADVVGIEPSE